jgi:HEPN domain-containing protein
MNARESEALRWFHQAQADMEVVRTLQSAGHYAAACFFSQQTAEKALKAVLYRRGSRVVIGHSVRELARQCETHDPSFARMQEAATLLDQFYIPTRYPNGLPAPAIPSETYTASQAQAAQQAAEDILQVVDTFLQVHG